MKLRYLLLLFCLWASPGLAQQAALAPGFNVWPTASSDSLGVTPVSANVALSEPGPLAIVVNQSRTSVCLALGEDNTTSATWPCADKLRVAPGQAQVLSVTEAYGDTPYLAGITAPGSTGGTLLVIEGYTYPILILPPS